MKVILRNYGIRMTSEERQVARATAADLTRTRGTAQRPGMPRDITVQPGPRGILVNWRQPAGFNDDIAGYRIYKDTEDQLFAEIRDPNTTQHFIDTTAGATPPPTNVFISCLNKLDIESPKVQATGAAITEAGAPTMPNTPPTYTERFCPLSGAPVKLYGNMEWWSKKVIPWRDFYAITTETGRKGTFSRQHRMYSSRGLLPLHMWVPGDKALTDEGEEMVVNIEKLELDDASVDCYEATQGHIYSAWGFISHNLKPQNT